MGSSRMNRLLLILFVTVTMAALASSVVGKGKGVRTGGEQRYAGKQVRKLNSEKTGRNVRPVKEGRKTGNVKKTITTGKEGRKAGYGKKTLPRKQERNAVNEKKIGVRKSSSQEAARQDTSCVTSTACIGNATNYYNKILIKKVYNFKIQRERIKTFSKQSSGKNSKNEIFILLINRIREVGGGNSSNLTCNGENNDGATNLETLSTTLSECETKIYEACDSSQSGPNANSTYIDECNDLVDAFTDMTDTATKAKGAAACVLWEADDLKTCTSATVAFNKQTTKAKQKCTKAFSACKTAEDSVTAAVSACSPSNTVTKVTAAIKQGYQNIASIGDLKTKVDALITDSSITVNSTNSTSNRHRRQASSSTAAATTTTAAPTTTTAAGTTTAGSACSTFIDAVATAIAKLNAAPLLSGTQTLIEETNSLSVASCTVSEQSALATESVSITSSVTNVETIISVKQTDIDTQTGTTIEASELSITTIAATTATGTSATGTTATGTTGTGTTATGTTATGTTA